MLRTISEESLGPGLVLWYDLSNGKMSPHRNIRKYTWTFPDGKTHNQIDHILIDRRWIFTKRDVGAWTGSIWLRIGTGGTVYQIAVTTNARNFLHLNQ
jgi:hypothetical protein